MWIGGKELYADAHARTHMAGEPVAVASKTESESNYRIETESHGVHASA
jgi:hypothetical protein